MKDDAPLPDVVPRKRRQVEALLDRHIAIWLADDALPRGDRLRLEAEKARRRAAVPTLSVGVLLGRGGVTPAQLDALPEVLAGATEVLHVGVPSRLHARCKSVAPVRIIDDDPRGVVRAASRVVGLPAGPASEVWDLLRYARHRGLPTKVIQPDGGME